MTELDKCQICSWNRTSFDIRGRAKEVCRLPSAERDCENCFHDNFKLGCNTCCSMRNNFKRKCEINLEFWK